MEYHLYAVIAVTILSNTRPAQTFNCPVDSNTFDVSNQVIGTLSKKTFEDLGCSSLQNLTRLILHNASITMVDMLAFADFQNLTFLDLSSNQLQDIPDRAFENLELLQELDLRFNQLTVLKVEWMTNKRYIQKMRFDHNTITHVDNNFVSGEHTDMRLVSLTHNRLTSLGSWPFNIRWTGDKKARKVFDLSYNKIQSVGSLDWVSSVKNYYEVFVNLQHNDLSTLDMESGMLLSPSINAYSVLGTFDLRYNPFFCDCKFYHILPLLRSRADVQNTAGYTCAGPPSLRGVNIITGLSLEQLVCDVQEKCPTKCRCENHPHNQTTIINCRKTGLSELPKDLPKIANNKFVLFFSENAITSVKSVWYADTSARLSLEKNRINTLEPDAIKAFKHLKHLNLKDNILTHVPKEIQVLTFEKVDLTGNPLSCDCSMKWMSGWIQIARHRTNATLNCYYDDGKVIRVEDAEGDESLCKVNQYSVVVIILSTAIVLLIFLTFVLTLIFRKKCAYIINRIRKERKKVKNNNHVFDKPDYQYDTHPEKY